MTEVFAPVREASRLWLLTAPQPTLQVFGAGTTVLLAHGPGGGGGRPASATPNNNGSGHAHSEGAREAGATGGTS